MYFGCIVNNQAAEKTILKQGGGRVPVISLYTINRQNRLCVRKAIRGFLSQHEGQQRERERDRSIIKINLSAISVKSS